MRSRPYNSTAMACPTSEAAKIKTVLTDQERSELVKKLDGDIDKFMDGLTRKKYEDGWDENNWEEEFEKHPFLMTELGDGQELPPLVEALQQLKYDSNENTPEELAQSYKEDGNVNFNKKDYKCAKANYTAGIEQNCDDDLLTAQLYTNRAAAKFHLGNYRSSLNDATSAIYMKSDHLKAIHRGIQCCLKLSLFEEVKSWADKGLAINPECEDFKNFKKDASRQMALKEVERRKKERQEKNDREIIELIKKKGIKLATDEKICDSPLDSLHPAAAGYRVHPNQSKKNLIWPVIILYPEHGQSDFIHSFSENTRFIDVVVSMFAEKPGWDVENKYIPNNMEIFYEEVNTETFIQLNIKHTLAQMLSNPRVIVYGGNPTFLIMIKNSEFSKSFHKKSKIIN